MTNHSFKAMLGGMALAALAMIPSVSEAQQQTGHSVSGSGFTIVENDYFYPGSLGFTLRHSISATVGAGGAVSGSVVVQIDGLAPKQVTLVCVITCLSFDGKTAFFGGVILNSNNPEFAKPGGEVAGFITDGDGNVPDLAWSGPSDYFLLPGQTCADHPFFIAKLPLANGNFIVR